MGQYSDASFQNPAKVVLAWLAVPAGMRCGPWQQDQGVLNTVGTGMSDRTLLWSFATHG
jgi:hypothetical protein